MKLLEHLILLSDSERKHFLALSEIWYPKAKTPQNFLRHLISKLDQTTAIELDKINLGEFSTISKKRLQNMQTTVLSWFRRFLADYFYHEQNYHDMVAYINFCLDKEFYTSFIYNIRNRVVKTQDFADTDSLQELYMIHHVLYYHPLAIEKEKIDDPVFNKMSLYFEAYQWSIRLEHLLESLARKAIVPVNQNIHTLQIPKQLANYPLFKVYDILIAAYSSPSSKIVMNAQEVVRSHLNSFSHKQQVKFLHRIKNLYAYLIRAKQIDRAAAASYLFEHYNLLDQRNFLLEGESIQLRTFTNIVNVAIRVKKYEWINKFIRRYQKALPKAGRKAIVALTKADVLFSQGEFRKAIEILPKRAKDPLIEIRCKGLEICCMVELTMDEFTIEQKCRTLSAKLGKSSNVSHEILQAARNFLNIVRKLIFQEKEKPEIEAYFNSVKKVFFYDWLQHKIDDYPT